MPQLGGSPGVRSARSAGGVGAAVYSVKAKPLILGVTGDVVPFVMCSSDMVILRDPNSPGEVKLGKSTKANGWKLLNYSCPSDSFFPAEAGP